MDHSPLTTHHSRTLIAVDVGNSRVKWGIFIFGRLANVVSLPLGDFTAFDRQALAWQLAPDHRSPITNHAAATGPLTTHHSPLTSWSVASVNPDGSKPFLDWLHERGVATPLVLDDPSLLPLRVELDKPQAVGIDRLLDAVAVNARRPPGRPAVIVDAGSAITVDAVSAAGSFVGGTITVGMGLSARALHEFTYWLPQVTVTAPPPPLGKSTPDAMKSGLFWGTVGAVKELIHRMTTALDGEPVIYLTGGDSELLAAHLEIPAERVPELTLHGIYLASLHVRSKQRA